VHTRHCKVVLSPRDCRVITQGTLIQAKSVTISCADYLFSSPPSLSSSAFVAPFFPFDPLLAYLLTCSLLAAFYYYLPHCTHISSPFLFPLPTLLRMHLLTIHLCIIAPSVRASSSPLDVYYHALYACPVA
jgi:hypothetical protein